MSNANQGGYGGYTFFPYLRRGLATSITAAQNQDNSLQARAALSIGVTVQPSLNSTNQQAINAATQAQLHGPGDVLAINPSHIIRTEPLNLTRNFEPNYLAGIEFDQPDLPWVFTPVAPALVGTSEQLLPWIVLIALQDSEFSYVKPPPGPLPAISVTSGASLPPLSESWAWAHVQATGNSVTAASLQTLMSTTPSSVISRILCPRTLDPDTHYTAFLVPAFSSGVATGTTPQAPGGSPSSLPPTTSINWAWTSSTTFPLVLPYYYTFEFTTSDAGDFESLVNQIKPLPLPPTVGVRPYEVDQPGWGLVSAGGPMSLWGALIQNEPAANNNGQLIGINNDGIYTGADWAPPAFVLQLPAQPQAEKTSFQAQMAQLLDSSSFPVDNPSSPNPNDPIVTPPLYGRWYGMVQSVTPAPVPMTIRVPSPVAIPTITAPTSTITAPAATTTPSTSAPATSWVSQLNLDPRTRSIAGLGVQIVQIERNQLMASAWAQLAGVKAANQILRQMQLARSVQTKVLAKNFTNITAPSLLALASGALSRIPSGGASSPTVYSVLAGSQLPILSLSGAFRQVFRPFGPIRQRQNVKFGTPTTTTPSTGSLTISVTGVSSSVSVQVSITGPGGYTSQPTLAGGATTTLTNLAPGTYTVNSGPATGYQSGQASYQAIVTAGQTTTLSITYQSTASATGTLSITATGPPPGQAVLVNITGPNNYFTSDTISAAVPSSLPGLAPGTYTVAVVSSVFGYNPTQPSYAATVTAGSTANVTITFQSSGTTGIGMSTAIDCLSTGSISYVASGSSLNGLASMDSISAQAAKASGLSAADQKVLGQMLFRNLTPSFIKAISPAPRFTLEAKTSLKATTINTDSPAAASFRTAMEQLTTGFVPGEAQASSQQQPQQANLAALSQTTVQGLNPSTNLANRAGALVTVTGGQANTADPLAEIMWAPSFPQPMYAPLAALSQDYLIPGLETMPDETMSVLQSNPAFIESYMVGLNDEMGRQLLWNGFPTDQRATYFAQFWPPVKAPTSSDQGTTSLAGSDIPPIAQWPITNSLGGNMEPGVADAENVVLLIRSGSLFMRYPNTVVYAVQATAPASISNPVQSPFGGSSIGSVVGGTATPASGTTYVANEPVYVTVTGGSGVSITTTVGGTTTNNGASISNLLLNVGDSITVVYGTAPTVTVTTPSAPGLGNVETLPIFQGKLAPDVTFFGFNLTMSEVMTSNLPTGASGQSAGTPNWGYYFVFQQHPTEPRFGFELPVFTSSGQPQQQFAWSQVTWANLAGSETALSSTEFALLSQSMQDVSIPPTIGVAPNVTPNPDASNQWGNNSDSAQVAYITFRLPARIAIHADDMLQGLS